MNTGFYFEFNSPYCLPLWVFWIILPVLLRDLSGFPDGSRSLGWLEAFLYRHHCLDGANHEPRSFSAHASQWPFIRSFDTPQLLKTQAATSANSNLCLNWMFSLGPTLFQGG